MMEEEHSGTVVFVYGAGYCGTTMLDLMLTNTTKGFATMEPAYLFRPRRETHVEYRCVCFREDCDLWEEFRTPGESSFLSEIFTRFDRVRHITESSSAETGWYRSISEESPVTPRLVIVYKHPDDWMRSVKKRGRDYGLNTYVLAYLECFRLTKFTKGAPVVVRSVRLQDSPSATLQLLCRQLGLEYREDQERYWEKTHHMVFGSLSARLQLSERGTVPYREIVRSLRQTRCSNSPRALEHYRAIYSSPRGGAIPRNTKRSGGSRYPAYDVYEFLNQWGGEPSLKGFVQGLRSKISEAVRTNPENRTLLRCYMLSLMLERGTEAGLQHAKRFLGNNIQEVTHRLEGHRLLARYWKQHGEIDRAVEFFRRVARLADDREDVAGGLVHLAQLSMGKTRQWALDICDELDIRVAEE